MVGFESSRPVTTEQRKIKILSKYFSGTPQSKTVVSYVAVPRVFFMCSVCVYTTERHSRAVSTPDYYLGGPGLISRPGDRLPLLWVSVGFLSPSTQMSG